MRRIAGPLASLSLLLASTLALSLGCDKKSGNDNASQNNSGQQGGASTQAANASANTPAMPKIGVPYFTAETYKPVAGKYGGRIIRDTLGEPKSFNPITSGEASTTEYTMFMFQGLTTINPFTFEVEPLVAEKWTVSEDGLTWTFNLRKDVTFNDGSPLTAKDVVFSWNDLVYDLKRPTGAEPRWPSSMRDICTFDGKIIQVEAPDDYTVKFTLPVKVAIFDQLVSNVEILPQKKYAALAQAGTFGGAMGSDSRPEDIVGSGPFMLGQYVRGERVTLKKNPNYWRPDSHGKKVPYIDEFVTLLSGNLNTMLLKFQQKETDFFELLSGQHVAELRPKQQEQNFTLYQMGPRPATSFVSFNMNLDAAKKGKIPEYKVKWFRDTRFRQAVAHAIDRPAIVRNIMRNLGQPISAPFSVGEGPFAFKEFAAYPYDPAKSKKLLAEMGLIDRNGDGILEDEQGHKVQFTINTNSGNTLREEMANFIRTDLAKLGMEVNTLFLEFNLLVDKTDTTHDWECLVFSLTNSPDPHWGANVFKSSGRLHMWWPNQTTPSFDWEKRTDEIFATGIQEMDKAKRREIYREWVEIMHREQPFIYTTVGERVIGMRNRIGNFFPPPYPNVYIIWHNLEEMYVKE